MASEKKFNCTICLRSFRDKEQLENHIHTNSRNFQVCSSVPPPTILLSQQQQLLDDFPFLLF